MWQKEMFATRVWTYAFGMKPKLQIRNSVFAKKQTLKTLFYYRILAKNAIFLKKFLVLGAASCLQIRQ